MKWASRLSALMAITWDEKKKKCMKKIYCRLVYYVYNIIYKRREEKEKCLKNVRENERKKYKHL